MIYMTTELEQLQQNLDEFLESAKNEFRDGSYNSAVTLYFKALATYCSILIYKKYQIIPKDHQDRFDYLKMTDESLAKTSNRIFGVYRRSYNLRLSKNEAESVKKEVEKIVQGTKKSE